MRSIQYRHMLNANTCLVPVPNILFYAPRKESGEHIVAALSVRPSVSLTVRQSVSPSVRDIRVRPITSLFEVVFQNYFTEMTTKLGRRVARKIWVPT